MSGFHPTEMHHRIRKTFVLCLLKPGYCLNCLEIKDIDYSHCIAVGEFIFNMNHVENCWRKIA